MFRACVFSVLNYFWFKLYFFVYTSYMYMTTEELQYSNVIVIYKWDSEESLLTYICLYPKFAIMYVNQVT